MQPSNHINKQNPHKLGRFYLKENNIIYFLWLAFKIKSLRHLKNVNNKCKFYFFSLQRKHVG